MSWGHTCTVDCRLWTLERTSGTRAPRVGAAHPGVPTRAPSADRERRGHFELLRSLCKRSAGGRAPLVGRGRSTDYRVSLSVSRTRASGGHAGRGRRGGGRALERLAARGSTETAVARVHSVQSPRATRTRTSRQRPGGAECPETTTRPPRPATDIGKNVNTFLMFFSEYTVQTESCTETS